MKFVKEYKIWAIVLSICTIAFGVAMIIWPDVSAMTACYWVGAVCVAMGIYKLMRYFDLGLVGVLFRFDLGTGIFNVIAGVLLMSHPRDAMTIFPIVLGFYIIMAGIFSIQMSTEFRRFGFSNWWMSLLLGIVGVVLGSFMIADPFGGAATLMAYIGVSLVITGIQSIYTIFCLSKAFQSEEHRKIIDAVWHK